MSICSSFSRVLNGCHRYVAHATSLMFLSALLVPTAFSQTSPTLSSSPASLRFSSVGTGTGGVEKAVRVTNKGSAEIRITSVRREGTDREDFTQSNTCGAALVSKGSCLIAVRFAPEAAGSKAASLIIESTAGSLTIPLVGVAVGSRLSLSPRSVRFSKTNVGSESPAKFFSIRNRGKGVLTISSLRTIGPQGDEFVFTHDCVGDLTNGASCRGELYFAPEASGVREGAIEVRANEGVFSLSLSGTGYAAEPKISVSPSRKLSFSSQGTEIESAPKSIRVTNRGAAPLRVTGLTRVGSDRVAFTQTNDCATPIAPREDCQIAVRFTPQEARSYLAAFTIDSNAGAVTLELAGSGAGPKPKLSPSRLSFPTTESLTQSAPQEIVLSNTGKGMLTVAGIRLGGGRSDDFAVQSDCDAPLAPKASCTLSVRFAPLLTGDRVSFLTIDFAGDVASQSVSLRGQATPSPGPLLRVSDSLVRFSGYGIGTRSKPRVVNLINGGAREIIISSINIEGDASNFNHQHDCGSLAVGSRCAIQVIFSPRDQETSSARLIVRPSGSQEPLLIQLEGESEQVSWQQGPDDRYFAYIPAPDGVTWGEAYVATQLIPAPSQNSAVSLASISNQVESDFIWAILPDSAFIPTVPGGWLFGPWLGGSQRNPSGSALVEPANNWTWTDGRAFKFSNWVPGEPNNRFTGENYIHLVKAGTRLGWNDLVNDPLSNAADPARVPGFVVSSEQLPRSSWSQRGNNNFYQFVSVPTGISWSSAKVRAEALDAPAPDHITHLATVTTAAEGDFIAALVSNSAFNPAVKGNAVWGPWLGGFQDLAASTYREPSGGWAWVTGEDWSYTRWSKFEPNNNYAGASETFLHLFAEPSTGELPGDGRWNDLVDNPDGGVRGYVAETTFIGMPWIPGPNGHFYRYVRVMGGIDWTAARDAAASLEPPQQGYITHLATLTSAEEADFVSALIPTDAFVSGNMGGGMWGPWVGGYQDTGSPDYAEPGGGWRWVTGESWSYTRWSKNEPNNSAAGRPEGFLHLFAQPELFEKIRDGKWNDITDNPSNLIRGYIVEATPN